MKTRAMFENAKREEAYAREERAEQSGFDSFYDMRQANAARRRARERFAVKGGGK